MESGKGRSSRPARTATLRGMSDPDLSNRRPLASRNTGWAAKAANAMLAIGLTPNVISVIGIGFAGLGGWALLFGPGQPWFFLAAALGIQLRLLCNMLDGMVAVEGGKGSPTGALYNEAPDRIEDSLLLIAAGYAAGVAWLGWLAAVLSVFTAYVRALGGSLGFEQDFCGPMAKQHRMAVLTLGCLAAFVAEFWHAGHTAVFVALVVIVVGAALTGVRRLARVAARLREQA